MDKVLGEFRITSHLFPACPLDAPSRKTSVDVARFVGGFRTQLLIQEIL